MSLFTDGVLTALSNKAIETDRFKKLAKEYISKTFKENDIPFFDSNFEKPVYLIEHHITAFDGESLCAYQSMQSETNSYVICVCGYDQNYEFLSGIASKFEDLGLNSIFIQNRKNITFGIKESLDLLSWIDYFSKEIESPSFILFGEGSGAYVICKALTCKMNYCVKKIILDDLKSSILDDSIRQYCIDNHLENPYRMAKIVKSELNKQLSYEADEFDLKNSVKSNTTPICFVQSKFKDDYEHNELLKIFNVTSGTKKIFYTNVVERNFEQENYFKVLENFIEKY